jgi:pyruvate dehydrogenase E2 component (dihydrolipoamide acetyltransferase)
VVTAKKDNVAAFSTFTGKESLAQAAPSNPAPVQNNVSSPTSNTVAAPQQNVSRAQGDRIIATPYAKVIAKEKQVDLKSVQGSGPNGRIKANDVLNFKPSTQTQAKPQQASQIVAAPGQSFSDKPLTQMRAVIAQRLTESKQNVPHYYVTMEIVMDKLLK